MNVNVSQTPVFSPFGNSLPVRPTLPFGRSVRVQEWGPWFQSHGGAGGTLPCHRSWCPNPLLFPALGNKATTLIFWQGMVETILLGPCSFHGEASHRRHMQLGGLIVQGTLYPSHCAFTCPVYWLNKELSTSLQQVRQFSYLAHFILSHIVYSWAAVLKDPKWRSCSPLAPIPCFKEQEMWKLNPELLYGQHILCHWAMDTVEVFYGTTALNYWYDWNTELKARDI